MSTTFSARGAVDLSQLSRPQAPPPGEPGGAPVAGGYVVDVTAATFQAVIEASTTYPVLMLLWMPTDKANAEFAAMLGRLADQYAGRLQVARVDVTVEQQIAAAFQVQGVPTVIAVLGGQPIPLFAGAAAEEQVKGVLDQVLVAAEQAGVTGLAPRMGMDDGGVTDDGGASAPAPAGPPEPQLTPAQQEAYDALDNGDFEAAEAAFTKAHKQDPSDMIATAGLAQTRLLRRTSSVDLAAVTVAASAKPQDLTAQLAAADVDLLYDRAPAAFDRLLALLPGADADTKEAIRVRMVEYFDLIGPTDPAVLKARQKLSLYLY